MDLRDSSFAPLVVRGKQLLPVVQGAWGRHFGSSFSRQRHGKEPTSEDREYAEALGKLSELNYRAGYEAGAAKNKG